MVRTHIDSADVQSTGSSRALTCGPAHGMVACDLEQSSRARLHACRRQSQPCGLEAALGSDSAIQDYGPGPGGAHDDGPQNVSKWYNSTDRRRRQCQMLACVLRNWSVYPMFVLRLLHQWSGQ